MFPVSGAATNPVGFLVYVPIFYAALRIALICRNSSRELKFIEPLHGGVEITL
jgi:hypothetical protein